MNNDQNLSVPQNITSSVVGEIHPTLHAPVQLPSLNIEAVASQVNNKYEVPHMEHLNKKFFMLGLILFILISSLTLVFGILLINN